MSETAWRDCGTGRDEDGPDGYRRAYTTAEATHSLECSHLAREVGISPDSVQRIWRANDIRPHLVRTFKVSNDKYFEQKFWDVIGLYLDPPERA